MPEDVSSQSNPQYGKEWAGSLPEFPRDVGRNFTQSYELSGFRSKRLLFGRLEGPGDVHVYSTNCCAGARVRAQMLVPVLPSGGGLAPAFAVIAQGLPYSADVQKMPLALPAGYSAVVADPPGKLMSPVRDRLTGARYYPGPVVDTRTLVSGRCYVLVWSPKNLMGKYVLQIGHRWPLSWAYWLRTPLFWWRIRGWYGLSRAKAYFAGVAALGVAGLALAMTRRTR